MAVAISKVGKHRIVVTTALFTRFADGVSVSIFTTVAPLLALQVGASASVSTMISAVSFACWLLAVPYVGALSDKIGRVVPIRVGLLLNLIGAMLPLLLFNMQTLLLSRVLAGFGSANSAPCGAALADISGPEDRAKMMGMRQASLTLGLLAGPLIAPFATSSHLYGVFMAMTVLFSINLVLVFIMPESSDSSKKSKLNKEYSGSLFNALPADIWPALGVCFMVTFAFALVHSSLPLILADIFVLGQNITDTELILSKPDKVIELTAVSMSVATVMAFVTSLSLSAHLIKILGSKLILTVVTFCWAVTQYSTPYLQATGWYPYLGAVVIVGACYGVFYPSLTTLLSLKVGSRTQGSLFGVIELTIALGMLSAPLLSGTIYVVGTEYVYWLSGTVMALALLGVTQLKERPKRVRLTG